MGRTCKVYGCDAKQSRTAEHYCAMVAFPPKEDDEFMRWVSAIPNSANRMDMIAEDKKVWICASHFECEYKSVKGGKRPIDPPSVFPNIPNSFFVQNQPKRRSTHCATSDQREIIAERKDKIKSYEDFVKHVATHVNKNFHFVRNGSDFTMYMTDLLGRKVVKFIHFREEKSPFGFLKLVSVERNGCDVPKTLLDIQKNHYIHKWSKLKYITAVIDEHLPSNSDRLSVLMNQLSELEDFQDSTHFQFLLAQLDLMSKPENRRRYSKHIIVFAVELFGVSPAAYRMIRRSKSILLPRERRVREILSKTDGESNLAQLLEALPPEQRLVNVLFDEVKLVGNTRFTAGHVLGMAENQPDKKATHAFVIELVCHHGGPTWVLRVVPVTGLKGYEIKNLLVKTVASIRQNGGLPIALICDNAATNRSAYNLLGGPGIVQMEGISLFLMFDFVHIFKNIRNNWYTEVNGELSFTFDGKVYVACWKDIVNLYMYDQKSPLRITKLTQISVAPKPLQRQSVPLVCNIFNDKTVAALEAQKGNESFSFQEGTLIFVSLINDWFKMMNVKDTLSTIKLKD